MKKSILILILSSLLTTQVLADQQPQIAWVSTQVEKKDVPQNILDLDPRAKNLSEHQKYEITLGIVDDNKWITDTTGDDRGNTYGHFLKASVMTKKGLRLTINYSGDLYTADTGVNYRDANGSLVSEQNTIEESVVKFVVDNAEKGKLLYYQVGAGWQILDGSGQGAAAKVQQKFHSLVKEIRQPVNVYTDYRKKAFLAEAAIGLQKKYALNSQLLIEENIEIGARATGIENASYLSADTATSLVYKPDFAGGLGLKLTAGITAKAYDVQTEIIPYAGVSFLFKKGNSCGVKVARLKGDLVNYQIYNLPNQRTGEIDDIWTASCNYKF